MMIAKNLIDGTWQGEAPLAEVRSPANLQEMVGQICMSREKDVDAAVGAAEAALPGWRRHSWLERGNLLYKAADLLDRHLDELGSLAAREMGKPLLEAKGEAARSSAILRYYAGEGFRAMGEVIPAANAGTLQYTVREPLGVVGVITPWNFPLAIPMWKVAPALIFGNTVVLKPAELSSLTAFRMFELIAPLFPHGVINVVHGQGSVVGEALVNHPKLHGVSFTGSTGVGSRISAIAAERGIKFQLEMGGKNPVVVADDADVDLAVERTISGAMRSAGQKCTATSRVIVLPGVRKAFTDALVGRAKSLEVGDPQDEKTYLGPVVSKMQRDKVLDLIAKGLEEHGELLAGGGAPAALEGKGYYVAPTIFGDVGAEATIAQEEIFGPVVAVMEAASVPEAISLANSVRYGLSASIFTSSLKTAMTFVEGIEAGMVRVNEESAGVELQAPFGGMKASSSHSREQGRAAIEFFTHTKTVAIRTN